MEKCKHRNYGQRHPLFKQQKCIYLGCSLFSMSEDSDTSVWPGTVENAPSEITITEVAFLELPIFSVLILSMGSCITEILSPYKDA